MSSSPDDYSEVQRLLKLKRYEQPPPKYFDSLSGDVLHRLRGPEGLRQQTLLGALGLRFGVRPALFYGLGAICTLLAGYGVVSLLVKQPPAATNAEGVAGLLAQSNPPSAGGGTLVAEPSSEATVVSTNPILNPGSVTFPVDASKVRPVSSRPPSR